MLAQLPRFTATYGIKPWEIDRLTMRELSQYLIALRRADTEGGEGHV